MKTVLELLREVTGSTASASTVWREASEWPADAFALAAAVLADSGAYRRVVSPPEGKTWPPQNAPSWEDEIARSAQRWIRWCDVRPEGLTPSVSPVASLCKRLAEASDRGLADLGTPECWATVTDLLTLQATADLACSQLGLSRGGEDTPWEYTVRAGRNLSLRGTLAHYPAERIRVLPKTRTSQLGITLRSLSHHVAMCRSEVDVQWIRTDYPAEIDQWMRLRVLLFPWPFDVRSDAFTPVSTRLSNMRPEKFGFFDFTPKYDADELISRFNAALGQAERDCEGGIDFVVLPEGALTEDEFETIWSCCASRKVHVLLSGVRAKSHNQAWLRAGLNSPQTYRQDKHHRWCLDDSQIDTYDLGTRLHPSRRWWESMAVERRALTFVAFNDWLTFCHLICEDLARIDPVSQIVRAVGPTLVVALLLDGPQLPSRWPARYATVLADDPGSSVLTLTALGMALRSRPRAHPTPNPTIALWKDSKRGDVPIVMAPTSDAVALTLWADRHEEFTADGRSDGGTAGRLVLGGVTQIRGFGWSTS